DLDQLRIGFKIMNRKRNRREIAPRLRQVMCGPISNPLHQPLLNLRQRPLRDEQIGVRSAQQAIDDRINNQGADFQTELPIQLLRLEQIKAGRIGQRVNKLAVSELLNVGDVHFDNGSEVAGQRSPEISPKS